jgi:hypothetical protein
MNTKKNSGCFRTRGETIIAKACRTVPGFAETYQTFERTLTLRQRSKSAMQNYVRCIAQATLHFNLDDQDSLKNSQREFYLVIIAQTYSLAGLR